MTHWDGGTEADATSPFDRVRALADAVEDVGLGWDAATATLLIDFKASPVPCFTRALVKSVLAVGRAIAQVNAGAREAGPPVRHVVLHSTNGGWFSSGGDLREIAPAARARDEGRLVAYGEEAADACHGIADGFGAGVLTVAAVDGLAIGSGFEVARCCDVLVASPGARFRFPEVGYGLHPGHGAMTVLSHRVPSRRLAELVVDASWLERDEAIELGVVDAAADRGGAVAESLRLLAGLGSRRAAVVAFHRGRNAAWGITRERVRAESERWARHACSLGEGDLTRMERAAAIVGRRAERAVRG